MERCIVRDVGLTCLDHGGPGTPVLILHGLCGCAEEWTPTARRLAGGHRVVVPDARGHGRSERLPADTSRAAHVADAAAWVEWIGEPAVVVGQSLGGHTGFLLAARRPELVRSLVVVESTPDAAPEAPAEVHAWLEGWPHAFGSREDAQRFFGAKGWVDCLDDDLRPRFDPEVVISSLDELAARPFWDEWAAVRCPALIVRGEHGIPPEACERMRTAIIGASVVTIEGAGHDPHLEQPEAFVDVLEGFLARS